MKFNTSNKACRAFVNEKKTFKASHLFSEWVNGLYVVFSYGHHFPLYIYMAGIWYGNSNKYSVSTSRHASQARPDADIQWLPTDELQIIISNASSEEVA